MARLIAQGAEKSNNCEAILRTVPAVSQNNESIEPELATTGDPYVSLDDLTTCAGLALGSPTRFGNMATPLKYFLEQTSNLWMQGVLADKPATVFTSTSSLHGGQESTLLSMMLPLFHHGMILAGVPYSEVDLLHTTTGGTPYGTSHWAGVNNDHELSKEESNLCIAQGFRLAKLAVALKGT